MQWINKVSSEYFSLQINKVSILNLEWSHKYRNSTALPLFHFFKKVEQEHTLARICSETGISQVYHAMDS